MTAAAADLRRRRRRYVGFGHTGLLPAAVAVFTF
jgi:hypothetical protein